MRTLLFPLLLAGAAIAVGCASVPAPTRTVKLAVLDSDMMIEVPKAEELTTESYWFGQRDVMRSSSIGIVAGDHLARRFSELPGVEVYSREDLIVYLARKERLLRQSFPQLTAADRTKLLTSQSAVDYGKSLNVDYVLSSTITRAHTTRHEMTEVWLSKFSIGLELWDVAKGERVWVWNDGSTEWFDSTIEVAEELAEDAAEDAWDARVFAVWATGS